MLSGNELRRGKTSDFFRWYLEIILTIVMFTVFPFPLLALPGFLIAGAQGWVVTVIALLAITFIMGIFEYVLPDEAVSP